MMTPTTMRRNDWQQQARCSDHDPDGWYPISETGAGAGPVARAKYICGGCPVRVECLNQALESGEQHGIWGGKTATERELILRQRSSKAPRPAPPATPRKATTRRDQTLVDAWHHERNENPSLSIGRIAERLGVHVSTLGRALRRAREEGDSRIPQTPLRATQHTAA